MRSKICASQPQTDLLVFSRLVTTKDAYITECDDLLPDLTLRPAALA